MTKEPIGIQLPVVIEEYLAALSKRVKNHRVQADVLRELRSHFLEAMADVEEKDREKTAGELIREFGEPDLLAELIKRAKKRCRPAWQKFIIRSLQGLLGIIIFLLLYSLWAFFDKPSPTIDYVAELNALARPAAEESENGASFYIKANERFVDYPKNIEKTLIGAVGMPLSPAEKQIIRNWIGQNEPALELVREASQKPHAWFTYKGDKLTSILLPNFSNMRGFVRLLYCRIWLIDGDDQAKILADLRPTYMMARHIQEKGPTLIEQLVGNAINTMSAYQTRQLLRMGIIKAESFPALAKFLDETYPHGYLKMSLSGELICGLDIIQRTFTNGGLGGGHLCPQAFLDQLDLVTQDKEDSWEKLMKKPQLVFFITHPRRNETTEKMKEYYALLDQWNVSPYEQSLKGKYPGKEFLEKNKNNLILSVFLPALESAMESKYRGKAEFEATRTVIALLQYKQDRGRYPETLTDLVPEYLKELPRDPYGPDTMIYRRNGEDFLLYSRGVNFEDNGGKHLAAWGTGRSGNAFTKDGDYVFWPVALPERRR